ncbi:MAG TPA: hypothetical protein VIG99_27285 [Myxococcaceae bacterium]
MEIGLALRRPEALALRWRDRRKNEADAPPRMVFPLLLANAILGIAAYGLTMGLHQGMGGMLAGALKAPFAAGLAWTVALPALYIINSSLGSKLDSSTTVLAALATVSFGALAMLASVPVSWFFSLALPYDLVRTAVNLVVFSAVGICMVDVFLRTMKALEPDRSRFFAVVWLLLVAVIGAELMVLVDLFAWRVSP